MYATRHQEVPAVIKEDDMARAHRHYVPGQIWHLTQRCHDRTHLLKRDVERRRWMYWLYQARKRFGLSVLNYIVTRNHVHVLVRDSGDGVIASSMHLLAGRTAQEFNRQHERRGAFWEDRYHATAVQSDLHLARCLTYIDLNMVRAGVVKHPSEWRWSGYAELHRPKRRGGRLDYDALCELLRMESIRELQQARASWIDQRLEASRLEREAAWTEALAVGTLSFALGLQRRWAVQHPGRRTVETASGFAVSEPALQYSVDRVSTPWSRAE